MSEDQGAAGEEVKKPMNDSDVPMSPPREPGDDDKGNDTDDLLDPEVSEALESSAPVDSIASEPAELDKKEEPEKVMDSKESTMDSLDEFMMKNLGEDKVDRNDSDVSMSPPRDPGEDDEGNDTDDLLRVLGGYDKDDEGPPPVENKSNSSKTSQKTRKGLIGIKKKADPFPVQSKKRVLRTYKRSSKSSNKIQAAKVASKPSTSSNEEKQEEPAKSKEKEPSQAPPSPKEDVIYTDVEYLEDFDEEALDQMEGQEDNLNESDLPSDGENESDYYDDQASSDTNDGEEWFTLDIRAERGAEYIPLLGDRAEELLLKERLKVKEKLESLRQGLHSVNTLARTQAKTLEEARKGIRELDQSLTEF